MTAEVVRLIPPTRVTGGHLRCPICGQGTYTNVVSQSYGVCQQHKKFWRVGQCFTDRWLKQSPAQWRVNRFHLDRMELVHQDPPRHSGGGQSGDAA
jgi:hypothetical protein